MAPNISLLRRFEDLAPLVEGRPAGRLAQRVAADVPGEIGMVLPPEWLAPIRPASSAPLLRSGPMRPDDALRAIGFHEHRIASPLHRSHG